MNHAARKEEGASSLVVGPSDMIPQLSVGLQHADGVGPCMRDDEGETSTHQLLDTA